MKETDFRDRLKNTGRNDVCPCGSGRKYKKCHLPEDEASEREEMKKPETLPPATGSESGDAAEKEVKKPSFHADHADVAPKVKKSRSVARINVPRRQAGK